jgi:hypothetical protein
MRQRGIGSVVRNCVVVYDQDTIGAQMDIQLDPVGSQLDRSRECRNGVLRAFAGGSAMGDDLDRRHHGSSGSPGVGRAQRGGDELVRISS